MNPEILDWDTAVEQIGGSEEILDAVSETLFESVPELLEQIKSSANANDAIELRRAAHTLKGAVAVFCARPAHEAALKLEELAKAESLEEANTQIPIVEREAERLVAVLKQRQQTS